MWFLPVKKLRGTHILIGALRSLKGYDFEVVDDLAIILGVLCVCVANPLYLKHLEAVFTDSDPHSNRESSNKQPTLLHNTYMFHLYLLRPRNQKLDFLCPVAAVGDNARGGCHTEPTEDKRTTCPGRGVNPRGLRRALASVGEAPWRGCNPYGSLQRHASSSNTWSRLVAMFQL